MCELYGSRSAEPVPRGTAEDVTFIDIDTGLPKQVFKVDLLELTTEERHELGDFLWRLQGELTGLPCDDDMRTRIEPWIKRLYGWEENRV
jgi:hypothetical protein